jgi:hypothetical protein
MRDSRRDFEPRNSKKEAEIRADFTDCKARKRPFAIRGVIIVTG